MSSLFTWLRHHLAWSNSRQSWEERAGLALLLAGLAVALTFGRKLPLPARVAVGAGLLLATAVLFRRGWLKLFGPVLFYDMLRVSRRSRFVLFRSLYALGLLLILSWVYSMWWFESGPNGGVRPQDMADFAESFFFTFMIVQAVLVLILTPAYVAGSVAEEKERQTLEYLLATDLRNREIVLGKLVSRVANLTLLVLAGLPVLSATQFLGGVDPDLLLACFALVGLTLLSVAAVSILFSVRARRPRDAIVQTYLVLFLYPIIGLIALGILATLRFLVGPSGNEIDPLAPVLDFVEGPINLLNVGNLVWLVIQMVETLERGGSVADQLPGLLEGYAIFHGIVMLVCVCAAVLSLRAVALREVEVRTPRRSSEGRSRAPVGDAPMWWKEIHIEPTIRLGWLGRSLLGIAIFSSFLPVVVIFAEREGGWRRYHERAVNVVFVRGVGTSVACLLLLAVAVRAAGSVSSERERQTLDALLTSPLSSATILWAKWVASILSVRWGWAWLGAIWLIGLLSGGLNPCAVPMLLGAWVIYAGTFAAVGLWFSIASRTTQRATVWTLLTVLFLGGGHWLTTVMCCFMPLELSRSGNHSTAQFVAKFMFGQTPPLVLGLLAFHHDDFRYSSNDMAELMIFSIIGLVMWVFGTILLWGAIQTRFRESTGRLPEQRAMGGENVSNNNPV